MSDISYDNLHKGDTVIFARVIPKIGCYDPVTLKIVSVYDNYCTGVDTNTKQTYPFSKKYAEDVLFLDKKNALEYLKQKKKENKNIKVANE